MRRCSPWAALALCTAAAITGCATEDPLPPAEVQGQIQTHLGDLLAEVDNAIANSWEVLPQPDVLTLLQRVLGADTPVARLIQQLAPRIAVQPPPIDIPAAIAYLNDRVFDETSYRGGGIYEVSPAVVCAKLFPGNSDGSGSPSVDAGCEALIARLDLRLHTMVNPPVAYEGASPDQGIVVAVQFGPDHDEPLTLTLHFQQEGPWLSVTWLTAELDLDILQRALSALVAAKITGVPRTELSGQLTATLQGDPTAASLRLKIDRPISIALAGASGDLAARDAFALSSASAMVFDLIMVANWHPAGSLELGLGETALTLPAAGDGKRVGFHLDGLICQAALELPPLMFAADIGLGGRPATLSLDGAVARTIDINPDDGGTVFLGIYRDDPSPGTGVRPDTLHANPRLDLRMTADHGVLGGAPLYDVSRIVLDGLVADTTSPDRIELRTGTYDIDTTPAGHGVAAVDGQCITGTQTTGPDSPPFIQWIVSACP